MGDSAHTTHHTNPRKKSAPPLFLKDENIFQKSTTLVVIHFRLQPTWPIFEKCSHLRELFIIMNNKKQHSFRKRGGADAFENDPPFRSKGSVLYYVALCIAVSIPTGYPGPRCDRLSPSSARSNGPRGKNKLFRECPNTE
jgi:hypothetical protein